MLTPLTPEPLRHPRLIVPLCVLSLSLGLQLQLYVFTDWYPAIHVRMIDQKLVPVAFSVGVACLALPVTLLLWAIKQDSQAHD